MRNVINAVSEFWGAWGPWITMSLIPTILTGLTMSPKTAVAHGVAQKIWNGIKTVLEFFSIATFKNVPGTFQLPLKMGRMLPKKETPMKMVAPDAPPRDVEPPRPGTGPGSCAALILVFALSASTLIPGCAWWNEGGGKSIKEAVIDCSKEAVKANAAHLLPTIVAILTGKAPNWKQQIEAFVKELGRDAVACSMQMASMELLAKVPAAGTGEPTPEAQQAQDGVTKARTYTAEKGWKYAPAGQ